ncbi:MAG: protein phosphatase 2C domain-containing protein [Chloroflexi bacterium]|nr:protein phosphatase 2C domain-containing protein [Chloroflexota bacterium]
MNLSEWHVVGASVQGSAHTRQGAPCQDAHGWRVLPDDILILAVADGAGSAPRSLEGAQAAVGAVLATLADGFAAPEPLPPDVLLRDAFARAREALAVLAAEAGVPLAQFASTLTCAIAGANVLTVASLGDGAVIAETGGELRLASAPPQKGEYANETHFLTQDDARDCVQIARVDGTARAVAATTDGLLRLALRLPDYAPHAPFFQPLFAFAAQAHADADVELAAFLCSERVTARTDDDKTLVIAVRVEPQLTAEPA